MNTACITLEQLYQFVTERLRMQGTDNKRTSAGMGTLKQKEQVFKMEATDGSLEAREYLKNSILFILGAMKKEISPENIDKIIGLYHINYFTNVFTGGNVELLESPIDAEVGEYFDKYSITSEDAFDVKLSKLSQITYQELFGFSILDELVFDGCFNEVAANRFDYIWIQYKGIKKRIPNPSFRFISEEYYSVK
jgi:pilus assembly protein CpaF